ncbi:MAG: HD domain-containing protein, partial [Clostridiales bacterium]|nr:HD domain-containing protein [Clostridiales bacterium]
CYNENALVRYDHGNVTVFRCEDGMPSERVRAVYERSDGTIMVACTGGLALIEGDTITEVYDETSGISNIEILTVCEAPNGDMLVGTDGDGIYVIHDASVMHIGMANGLSSEVVMRIKKDPLRDILWIVTSNSLAYMDADLNVTTIEQFPYSNNFDLYENSQGEMWILSSNGIYVTTAEELLANGEITTVFYGRDNGLPCIATSNSYSGLSGNGDLYLAGSTGVAKVNIEVPFEDVTNLKVAVPFIAADGVPVYPDSDGVFNVGSDVNKVTIYAYVYTYSLSNPQITYYLDGFNEEANSTRRSELNPIDYTNLRGGTYRFVMQIKDSMGHGYNELTVTIVKQKAFYETLSFKIMCIMAVILVGAVAAYIYGRARTRKLMKKQSETMLLVREMSEAFAKTIDMKDKYTKGHSTRVANYTSMLSEELGYDKETVDKYYYIALLHDIGKIGVPPEVLNKAGKLSDDEFNRIKSHSRLGEHVLKEISIMPELAIGAGSHHERPDGKGYPQGLKGDEIPRVAQIIAVADTFDAMYSDRPYRKRMNFEKAVSIIREVSGTQLTSDVVDAFLRLVEKGIIKPAADDEGGGTFEDIDNIHKRLNKGK